MEHVLAHGELAGWLEVLGPRGPWIVERVIGMQEFPQRMDCDGRVTMLEACVRRACLSASGEVDTKLHQHVRDQTRVWCSDGADLQVPLLASGSFPGLVFHAWDEAHSAQRLCANALTDGDEISITDQLLVTGKKPYSLAKFLTTSQVFRKTVGDQQLADQNRVRGKFRVGAAAFQQSGEAVRARKSPLENHFRRRCHGGGRR